ncbi:hypothetical protein EDB89DRAFT_1445591 [Lactarius sanguifluus]|nr:hypothetical protein EDB89DRAFT_1445591 [Lactarius sanguifluus]
MDPSSRTTREQRSGMRDDNTGTGGQWDNPMSKGSQGKWELGRHFGGPSTAARTITGPRLSGQHSPVPLLIILFRHHQWPGRRYIQPTATWPERLRVRIQRRRRPDWYRPGWYRHPIGPVRDFGPVRRLGEGHDWPDRWLYGSRQECRWSGWWQAT